MSYHILSERLRKTNIVAFTDEVTKSKGVLVSITASKALIRHIEEGEVLSSLHGIRYLPPLLLRGVNAGRIVCTSMQQKNATLRGSFDICYHTLKVQPNCVLVVIAILFHG